MNPLPAFEPGAPWRAQLRVRVTVLWPYKMASNILGVAVFFAAYFWVLRNPQFPVTVMPLTAVDHWVTFESAAMPLYLTLWLYIALPLALLKNAREMVSYGWAWLALSATGLGIFFVYPTAVPPFGVDWAQHPSVAYLKTIDVSGNACPSLHVAFAVFSAVWLHRILNEMRVAASVRALSWSWCVGIVYSTLATRQHVALDVLGGIVLGLVVVTAQLRALASAERRAGRAAPPAPEGVGTAA
jgi:membrane-associated phospholipid phosphatase